MYIEKSQMLDHIYQVLNTIKTVRCYDEFISVIKNDIKNLLFYDKAIYVLAKRKELNAIKIIHHNYSKCDLNSIIDNENRIKKNILFNPYNIETHYSNVPGVVTYGFHERESSYVSVFHCSNTDAERNITNTKILDIIIPRLHSTVVKLFQAMVTNKKPIKSLSPREFEILTWISKGKTNGEIGIILGISSYTVKNHVSNILEKLNVANRAEALVKAIMH